jgi:hypothetical protein
MCAVMCASLFLFGPGLITGGASFAASQQVYAATTLTSGAWQYQVIDNGAHAKVVAYAGKVKAAPYDKPAKTITMPATMAGLPVTQVDINDAPGILKFAPNSALTSVRFEGDSPHDWGGVCQLRGFDLSKCPNLTTFYSDNQLIASANLTKNTKLQHLTLTACCPDPDDGPDSYAFLSSLNLSKNTKLIDIDLRSDTSLKSLTLPATSSLTKATLWFCALTKLDASHCKGLTKLDCSDNKISSLKLPAHKISHLTVFDNYLSSKVVKTLAKAQGRSEKIFIPQKGLTPTRSWFDISSKDPYYQQPGGSLNAYVSYDGQAQAVPWAMMFYGEGAGYIGKVTFYYDPYGAAGKTKQAPKAANRYAVYAKVAAGLYNKASGYIFLGCYTIYPYYAENLKVKAGNNRLSLSWKDLYTASANVSCYQVYYRVHGSKTWYHKTYQSNSTHKATLYLKNKTTYDVKVRVCKWVPGRKSELIHSCFTDTITAKTK